MNLKSYNNIGIASIAIYAVLSHSSELTLSKALLILPLFSSSPLTQHLSRSSTKVKSVEKLIAEKTSLFSNFNGRFYDTLALSINSIQFLAKANLVTLENGIIRNNSEEVYYTSQMGKRAGKIFSASENLSRLLNAPTEKLYLNLRIEL
ncbi:three component ABC system middle component [Salinimicrobium sp. TIG7-5_MAKvit]|uniref:three component ABC system middle component n=1 Tax=Salinimicrobium sp. TIG7-5_MAKvit TaxID=3121289 RepID=UPI003C6E9163